MDIVADCIQRAKGFGHEPLLVLPSGEVLDLVTGYIPLLSTFTHEDKAAKGLRKAKTSDNKDAPVQYSALELVRDNKFLLLPGESGSGKTTFAKFLCHRFVVEDPLVLEEEFPLVRNESGDARPEVWEQPALLPCYFAIADAGDFEKIVEETVPQLLEHASQRDSRGLLIILDDVDHAGGSTKRLIADFISLVVSAVGKENRVVMLGDAKSLASLELPIQAAKHNLSPFLVTQRRSFCQKHLEMTVDRTNVPTGLAAANPSIFALALQAGHFGDTAEATIDAWLATVVIDDSHAQNFQQAALDDVLERLELSRSPAEPIVGFRTPALYAVSTTRSLLAARYLATQDPQATAAILSSDSREASDIVSSIIARRTDPEGFNRLAISLLGSPKLQAQRAALLLADLPTVDLRERVWHLNLAVLQEGMMELPDRLAASVALSRLGDPRDLMALQSVPLSNFVMGSPEHPNSQPAHEVVARPFAIGTYPVTVREYKKFVQETSRDWSSPEQNNAARQNVPATDLTWYDAVAYCEWLTKVWHQSGRISNGQTVRLPTEPEWELAARGNLGVVGTGCNVYPWGAGWKTDACNSEELGLNQPCAVGVFPGGASPFQCHDMTGNIWEWCSTLWGENMTEPSYKFPYNANDGREDLEAPGSVRRVLRGGCFSSGKLKANCTYRGSLEANGRWRGNGFRIVVAPVNA
ncbi:hypothetical protein CKM354_000724000 [Cercospora kikuchii]|uniref:Sulfatase-modifying factor enzyme-like domain-containing protein n=1 Tax=Cercospora kikuchii TaxID=84275 RepID=A0A9P3CKS9_9PEZI|nr:uncharacterized protein CKM354_000724000 [Cercospora kikuchii]GIZ44031.1 hypothetical protein CKM354_000724000 [Cercospora kikuchii]